MRVFIKNFLRRNKYLEIFAYFLQNNQILNSSGEGDFSKDIDEMYQHFKNIGEKYTMEYGGDLKDKVLLEVGIGVTRATMLYLIKKYDIKKVYCYDRFNCLHKNENLIIKKYNLNSFLSRLEYIAGPNELLLKNIQNNSVDYIVSNAVLEHVDNLPLLFSILTKLLKSDGKMYHSVDLKCHNRFKKYGELYFHTFSNNIWSMMGDNIGQPNRKLIKDYIDIFNREELNIISDIKEFDKEDIERAKEYLNLSDNEIKDYLASEVEFKLCKK